MLATLGWSLLSILLVLIAICSLIPYQPKSMAGIAGYWALSLLGQAFSPQLGACCLLLIATFFAFDTPFITGILGTVGLLLYCYVYWKGCSTQIAINAVIDPAISKLNSTVLNRQASKKSLLPLGFRPLQFKDSRVSCTKDISYGTHGNANLLDIYQPKERPQAPMPILIFVPGGGWITGSKNEQGLPLLNHMAANGWLCVAINYRLGPQARFPAMLEDILNAISWVKTNATSYGGNPDFVAISGNSAGGHLSSIAALATPEKLATIGLESLRASINVAVPIYGRYDFLNRHHILPGSGLEPFLVEKVMPGKPDECPEIWALASPEDLVHKDAPPFLIIHGSGDAMIPVQEARAFHAALEPISEQTVDYLEIPGAQHGYDMVHSTWAMPTVYGIFSYLNAHHEKHLQSKTIINTP